MYIFRYLFNCGEGTQRLAHEHKIKISKLEHIFITYPRWENIGGLTGLALTLQDSGTPELSIHGPYGVVSNLYIRDNLNILYGNVTVMIDNENKSIYRIMF